MAADVQIRFRADSRKARTEIEQLQGEVRALRQQLGQTQGAATDAATGVDKLGEGARETARHLSAAKDRQSELNTEIDKATSQLGTLKEGIDATTAATEDQGTAVKTTAVAFTEYLSVISAAQRHIREFENLNQELEGFDDFWRVAAGEVGEYTTAVDLATVSVVDHRSELEALHTAGFFDGLDDPLAAYVAELEATSVAADAALGPLNQVNETVKTGTADFREAEARLYDYSDALDTSKRSHIDFTDVVDRETTPAVEDLTTALDETKQGAELTERAFESLDTVAADAADAADHVATALDNLDATTLDNLIGEFSQLDGVLGKLGTKIGQFDIQGLASGNPASIATLPFQLYNAFTFDQRQAAERLPELDRRNREAFERGEFGIPTDLLEFGRGQVQRALNVTDDSQLRALIGALNPQIGRTPLDEVATLPDRIIETIQSYTDGVLEGLQAELAQAHATLDFARQTGGDVEGALNAVIAANTALYQEQIDSYNLQRQATGRAIGDVDELNRILNDLNNETRLQISGRTRGSFFQEFQQRQQNRTSEEIDAEYAATFTEGDPNAQLPFRGGTTETEGDPNAQLPFARSCRG